MFRITTQDVTALDRQNLSEEEWQVVERLLSEHAYDRLVDAVQDARTELEQG